MTLWTELSSHIAPHLPASKTGFTRFGTQSKLIIELIKKFIGYAVHVLKEKLHNFPHYQKLDHVDEELSRLTCEISILRLVLTLYSSTVGIFKLPIVSP